MKRVLRPGGLVGGYTWKRSATTDFAAYAPMIEGVAASAASRCTRRSRKARSTGCALRSRCGLHRHRGDRNRSSQTFKNFDEYWDVQTLPFSPPGKDRGQARRRAARKVARLLRATLPAADGTITFSATAVAGKARKPD